MSKLNKHKIVKRAFFVFLFFFTVISLFFYLFFTVQEKIEIKKDKQIEYAIVNSKLEAIQKELAHAVNDLILLSLNSQMNKFWDDENDTTTYNNLSKDYLNLIKYKKLYDQARLLDSTGMELLRVNFNNTQPIVVSKEKLQNKKNRYYFSDAFDLNKSEIFVSPLDLNIEGGEIQEPLKPMIRLGVPVFDNAGKKRGVVLLNYFGIQILNQLKKQKNSMIKGTILLVNKDGYWLKGLSQNKEWGFMYEDKINQNCKTTHPSIWKQIKNNDSGQFKTTEALITFKTIYPLKEGLKSSTGSGNAFNSSTSQFNSNEYFWKIISYTTNKNLYKKRNERRKYGMFLFLFLVFSLLFVSWKIAKVQIYKIRAQQTLKKSEAQLKESNKAKDKFFSIIAHDLKSPFSSIIGLTRLLDRNFDKYDKKKQKHLISLIYKSSHNTYKLLENLLLWSRSQRGRLEFNPKKENLYLLANQTIEPLKQAALSKSINIINGFPENIFIHVDQNMFTTVIRNLISNAIKFTKENGFILLETSILRLEKPNFIKIIVEDTGVGISEKEQAKLFNVTTNTSTQGTNNEEGTGLGLVLCKEFIEKHGGEIRVESEEGKGSSFIFTVPII